MVSWNLNTFRFVSVIIHPHCAHHLTFGEPGSLGLIWYENWHLTSLSFETAPPTGSFPSKKPRKKHAFLGDFRMPMSTHVHPNKNLCCYRAKWYYHHPKMHLKFSKCGAAAKSGWVMSHFRGDGKDLSPDRRLIEFRIVMAVGSDNHLGGGNSKIFGMFIPIPGEMIHFDSYFSKGLKPPTSHGISCDCDHYFVFISPGKNEWRSPEKGRKCHLPTINFQGGTSFFLFPMKIPIGSTGLV